MVYRKGSRWQVMHNGSPWNLRGVENKFEMRLGFRIIRMASNYWQLARALIQRFCFLQSFCHDEAFRRVSIETNSWGQANIMDITVA